MTDAESVDLGKAGTGGSVSLKLEMWKKGKVLLRGGSWTKTYRLKEWIVEIECLIYSRSQVQRPVGMRSSGKVGLGKDEGCDKSPEGVVCCADSRKDLSMAGQVICFVSDLGWRGGGVGTGQLSQLWGTGKSWGMWRWRKGSRWCGWAPK